MRSNKRPYDWRAGEADVMFGKVREAIRVWWRPLTCVGIAASVAVNGVVLPLMNNEPVELMGWAAVITACATAFGVREWGKIKGADNYDA